MPTVLSSLQLISPHSMSAMSATRTSIESHLQGVTHRVERILKPSSMSSDPWSMGARRSSLSPTLLADGLRRRQPDWSYRSRLKQRTELGKRGGGGLLD